MAETIFWWVFTLAGAFVFFFSYGMVENLIRKWSRARQTSEPKLTPTIIDNSPDARGNGHSDYVIHCGSMYPTTTV